MRRALLVVWSIGGILACSAGAQAADCPIMPPMGGAQLTPADVLALADYVWALNNQNQAKD